MEHTRKQKERYKTIKKGPIMRAILLGALNGNLGWIVPSVNLSNKK